MRTSTLVAALIAVPWAHAADTELERRFTQSVRPFVNAYCIACHSGATPAAQFNLQPYTTMADVVRDYPHWNLVLDKLVNGDMPPAKLKQPSHAARQDVIDWIRTVRKREAQHNAGDPGLVLARRLSNSEYNNTTRDLTGVDMRPTREFPVDPANPAGFDNSGESLSMSPALLNKYLQAAREVADHMVLTPSGIDFAPHPMLVETDREKYNSSSTTEASRNSIVSGTSSTLSPISPAAPGFSISSTRAARSTTWGANPAASGPPRKR